MGDEPRYDFPSLEVGGGAPSAAITPDVPRPEPLPVPARTGLAADRRVRVGLTAAAAVLVVLTIAACGLTVVGLGDFVSGLVSGGTDHGVVQMQWAGDGRYAIVEYVGTGTDATTSVIAWDSVTKRTVRADGFRLVAVEPSSTQVWLARAPVPSAGFGEESTQITDEAEYSPWKEPTMMGMPSSDGPGTPWVWDAARGGAPMRPAQAGWRSWTSAAGITANLTVVPGTGLWPASVAFTSEGTAPVSWRPDDASTFTPLGWSPSGRYFAVWRSADYDVGRVVVIDATTGEKVAEDIDPLDESVDYDENDAPPSSYGGISGAAWDPEADSLSILRWETKDDGDTYRVVVTALAPGGQPRTIEGAPSAWRSSMSEPALLGRDGRGVLISIETGEGTGLWRVRGGRIESAGVFDTGRAWLEGAGAYSANGKLLVYASPDGETFFGRFESDAAVSDLTGRDITAFWPPK